MQNNESVNFSDILASSIHDMKNSLAMLLGSLAEITSDCTPTACKSGMQLLKIQHEGQRVNRDLMQLLSLYRINTKGYNLNIDEHYLEDFMEEISLENTDILKHNNINLITEYNSSDYAYFDKDLLVGIVNTIINNAYRYTKDTIKISAKMDNDYCVISIEDNGSGYPERMLINPNSEDKEINFSTGSTGLGLFFANTIAGMHKNKEKTGYIELSNTGLDGGGKFSIYLP